MPKEFLEKHNIIVKDSSELHFSEHKDCFAVDNGDSFKLQIFAPFTSCGTVVEHGNDDYAYSNEVVFETLTANGEERSLSVFQFRCIYEDKYIVSSGPMSPTKRTLQFTSGEGQFEVSMDTYRGPSFSWIDKHPDNPTVRLNDPVYVDIEFTSNLGFAERDLVTTVKSCYATATPEHRAQDHYHSLISGMCVSPEDESVEILENGNSNSARFKFNMFKWKGLIAYVYLHCEVHLCNKTIETCRHDEKMCHSREQKRRRRGITLPSYPLDSEESYRNRERRQASSQKYSIQADMAEYGGGSSRDNFKEIGESVVDYDLTDDVSDYDMHSASYDNIEGMFGGLPLPEEEELTDFITRGPLLLNDVEDIGTGQINSTFIEVKMNDEFLRVYIFSSIAIVICIIAMILTILVALKRRKDGLEKLAGINQVFSNGGYARQSIDGSLGNNTQHTDLSQKASIITGISTAYHGHQGDGEKMSPGEKLTILPAITGLPLPPTPDLLGPSGKLPPVLGSPVTTNSSIHNDDSSNGGLESPTGSDIYHNISDNRINTNNMPHQSSTAGHNNHNNSVMAHPSTRGSRVNLQHNSSHVGQLHNYRQPGAHGSISVPHHSHSSYNGHHKVVAQHSSNAHHQQRTRQHLQKAESSRLHSRPNVLVHNHNTKVERSKTSVGTNNHVHPPLYNKPSHNINKDRSRMVENNTISHTISNYSN